MSLGPCAPEVNTSSVAFKGQRAIWRFTEGREFSPSRQIACKECRRKTTGPRAAGKEETQELVGNARVENPGPHGCWRSALQQEGGLPPVVALGKFDSMHIGHRALAQAATALGGHPWLISFSGMAEVLGWKKRLPIVPMCDKHRVLASWASHCNGLTPHMRFLPFREIRFMSAEDFVRLLAEELGAIGVVAGENYRFGYQASGDARLLEELGDKYGLKVTILGLVAAEGDTQLENVSTTKIRSALSEGDVDSVQRYLGRRYRLVTETNGSGLASSHYVPASGFLNQPPADGDYITTVRAVDISPVPNERMAEVVRLGPCKRQAVLSPAGLTLYGGELEAISELVAVRITVDF